MSIKRKPAVVPRGVGHPKAGELVVRPFMVHNLERMKPENALKAARETIRTANALYARFNKGYPNPLNIDIKDLLPEAKACWEAIFAERGYGDNIVEEYDMGGRRTFEDVEEVTFAFECYVDWIRSQNFVKPFNRPDGEIGVMPIIPNQSNFAKWLGIPKDRITKVMSQSQEAQLKYKHTLADCLSEGAMVGVYQTASTIFTLKNMCDWADKYEDRSRDKADDLGVAEAEELMKQLGYARERAVLPPLALQGEENG